MNHVQVKAQGPNASSLILLILEEVGFDYSQEDNMLALTFFANFQNPISYTKE